MKRRAFTLIEVLVVIAIISILLALVIAGGAAARRKARGDSARAQFQSIFAALDAYRSRYGVYPPDASASLAAARTESAKALYDYLGPPRRAGNATPFLPPGEDQIGEANGVKFLRDPWGNPWVYLSKSDGDPPPSRHPARGADLVSPGPDGLASDAWLQGGAAAPEDADNISD